MAETKAARSRKRQLGQFLTPTPLAERLVESLPLTPLSRVLEPSFGDGSFVLPLVERFLDLRGDTATPASVLAILRENVFGVELDPELRSQCLRRIEARWGPLGEPHNLLLGDYLRDDYSFVDGSRPGFDVVVGNPPWGGTLDPDVEVRMERLYARRDGLKIKKETYSLFIVKAVEELKRGGGLTFVCSDSFMTIKTMRGLRYFLLNRGLPSIIDVPDAFAETKYAMVTLDFTLNGASDHVTVRGEPLDREVIDQTGNGSWAIPSGLAKYFSAGAVLADHVVCTSGMTIGKNELFLRDVDSAGGIVETYEFSFYDHPITLEHELDRARLNRLSEKQTEKVRALEANGATRRTVRATPLPQPEPIDLPHPDYRYYNKSSSARLYEAPRHAIFWDDDGDAVRTFKKNGRWYLGGVGGAPFFEREGFTWQLVAKRRINARYLPPGYILDSGAPCGFLLENEPAWQLYFILGWLQTDLASQILKTVLNHTINIQSKDMERLPYPHWVPEEERPALATYVASLVRGLERGEPLPKGWEAQLEEAYAWVDSAEKGTRREGDQLLIAV